MTDKSNPYAAPQVSVVAVEPAAAPGETRLRSTPTACAAGRGPAWIGEAWRLFKLAPLPLIVMFLLYMGVAIVAAFIPHVGDLFMSLTFGVWMAGWYHVFANLHAGKPAEISHLFSGFTHPRLGRLFAVGLVYIGLGLLTLAVIALLAVVLIGVDVFNVDSPEHFGQLIAANVFLFVFFIFLMFVGLFLMFGAVYYAPALIVFHDVPVMTACLMSFHGVLRNWLPLTVYGLLSIFLVLASALTLFLGLLVLMPVLMGAGYVAYRDIFLEGDAGPAR